MSVDPVVPAATGMVFHLLWYFIKNIFSDLRRDLRYGSVSKTEYRDILSSTTPEIGRSDRKYLLTFRIIVL